MAINFCMNQATTYHSLLCRPSVCGQKTKTYNQKPICTQKLKYNFIGFASHFFILWYTSKKVECLWSFPALINEKIARLRDISPDISMEVFIIVIIIAGLAFSNHEVIRSMLFKPENTNKKCLITPTQFQSDHRLLYIMFHQKPVI